MDPCARAQGVPARPHPRTRAPKSQPGRGGACSLTHVHARVMAAVNRQSVSHLALVNQQLLPDTSFNSRRSYGSTSENSLASGDRGSTDSGETPTTDTEGGSSNGSSFLSRSTPNYRFSCSYKYSPIQSKGSILVLVWNFLVFSSISGIYSVLLASILRHLHFIPSDYAWTLTIISIVRALVWIAYPLIGWFADTYFGRYKTLLYSMWIMWAGSLMLLVCAIVLYVCKDSHTLDHAVHLGVYPFLFVVVSVGLAGFQAIVIPFGTDQMPGASSDQLAAFVLWYFWTEYFGFDIVYTYLLSCRLNYRKFILAQTVLQVICITIALILNRLFCKVLDIERARGNPLKTIYGVLKFAKKHKTPQLRSAFTYWEDVIPSRLDLAKQRYGGLHTTEQVEDVKTFFRLIVILGVILITSIANVAMNTTTGQFSNHLKHSPFPATNFTNAECYVGATIDNLRILVIVLIVPLYHFLIHPFIRNYIPTILRRLMLGVFLTISSLLATMVIESVGHSLTDHEGHIPCLLTASAQDPKLNIDYRWLVIPNVLSGLAYIVTGLSLFEFVCAQAPHAMKGFLLGVIFSMYGVASAIGFLILLAFYLSFNCDDPPHVPLGCGFWYYFTNLMISLIGLICVGYVVRWYKLRKRDDLSFEPIHVEHYYEPK